MGALAVMKLNPVDLLYTPSVIVIIGLVYSYLPFMILPIYGSIEKLDPSLLEAALDLGAPPAKVFTNIILPLTKPGIVAGVLLVFVPAIGMFAVTDVLGGAKVPLVGNIIQNQFGQARDWPFGAALGTLLLAMFAAAFWLTWKHPDAEPGRSGILFDLRWDRHSRLSSGDVLVDGSEFREPSSMSTSSRHRQECLCYRIATMHIPDGFLDAKRLRRIRALAAAGVSYSVYQTSHHLPRRAHPAHGSAAAFIFAAQMLNFPVAGGTSGHLLGGTLAAILLGPSCGVLVVTSVLITQCFLSADGGLYALGANVLNMAVVDAFTGYFFYSLIRRAIPGNKGRLIGAAFGAWIGTVLAAVVCSGQLAFSGRVPAATAFPAMVGVHALIGIGEAVITVLAISTIQKKPSRIAGSCARERIRRHSAQSVIQQCSCDSGHADPRIP